MLVGIDVSDYQGTVDWDRVAQTHHFAFCKATEGTGFVCHTFPRNWAGIKAAGMVRGAYHFAQPDFNSPQAEVNWFLKHVGDLEPGDLLALDLEAGSGDLSNWTLAFMQAVADRTGFLPLLYSGAWFLGPRSCTGNDNLAQHGLWLAAFSSRMPAAPPNWGEIAFWQHTDSAQVNGVNGGVDESFFLGELADLAKYGKPLVDQASATATSATESAEASATVTPAPEPAADTSANASASDTSAVEPADDPATEPADDSANESAEASSADASATDTSAVEPADDSATEPADDSATESAEASSVDASATDTSTAEPADDSATESAEASTADAAAPDSSAPAPGDYIARLGDSIALIAAAIGVSTDAVMALNPQITDPAALNLGQVVHLPRLEPPARHRPGAARTTYVVESGDSMTSIAAKLGVTLLALERFNPQVENPNLILIGEVLRVPH